MVNHRPHAEIAGGGIGGFTAAAALAQRGWTVRVHERHSELRFIGAGIYVWENGLRVLEALGAYDAAVAGAHAAQMFEIRDRTNKLTERVPFNSAAGKRLYTIVRKQLTEAIVAAGVRAGIDIETGSEAISATPDGTLIMADGRHLKADLVIAADGLNSTIRDSLGLLKSRKRLADGAIRILVPRSDGDVPAEHLNKYIEFWSGTRRILYTPCSKSDLYLGFTCLDSDAAAKRLPIDVAQWKASFPHLAHLIERIGDSGRWDLFEVVKLHRWSIGRVAILGDAAHAQAPNLGQGGGCAMMNALGLSVAVEHCEGNVAAGLEAWERRERPLTEHTQRVSSMWGALTTWPDVLRSTAFKVVGKTEWLSRMRLKTANHCPTGTPHSGT